MQKRYLDGCRVRIDPTLVSRFKRLPGGVNEAGLKIVRDFGLKYSYDIKTDAFDIIGDDPEILHIAIETLRFWVEEDDYPSTGVTCQVGYPNRGIVIWRFHGDYAKKFNHLFTEDIARLKRVPSLYVKAVPTKRNPEYMEVFCNFLVYRQVKGEIKRISAEVAKIFQTDVFVPRSDFNKARTFARSKARDEKVLYALKEYPENNKIRVWLFARENKDVIKAKKDWIQHVGMIARDNKLVQEDKFHGDDMNAAVFIGHPSSAMTSERSSPTARQKADSRQNNNEHGSETGTNLKGKITSDLKTSPRGPKYDNSNFPRPTDFVYPINWDQTDKEFYKLSQENETDNPFNLEQMDDLNTLDESGVGSALKAVAVNPMAGEARWVREDDIVKARRKVPTKPSNKRIYVHLQVDTGSHGKTAGQRVDDAVKVFHTEKNLVPSSKLNARNVITSVTDPTLAPGVKRKGRNVRPGGKKVQKKPIRIDRAARLLKPILPDQAPVTTVRYQIKVNGLAIYMYKHFIVKLDHMDTLVNVVSTSLTSGGVIATSMFDQAGESVLDEVDVYLKIYGQLRIGENLVTSAGRLPAMGIIHVAAPIWEVYTNLSEEECVKDLHKTIYNALKTAEKHQYRKVGIPVISAEPYFGVPRQMIADVYVKALVDYSLAMGPLYPVLEIHIVDMDVDMLNCIKESYEKWAASPAFANMKTEFTSRENSLTSPTQLSKRVESAVSLKGARSHKSQNMVTFMEQSYTSEGNQIWTFEVLKNLLVHVYTGTLLSVEGVDGLVCGTDTNLKGALAKQFLLHGGPRYEMALRKARGKKELSEGDVVVSEGGNLNTEVVLHSIVESPIYRVSRKNLARLDNINNEVLHTANQIGITSLALPLIGTARLRETFEVEQCSLQLVDNIIEFSLSMERNLRIRELHLVNVSSTTTQSLTQALRTRAHTKLRVEVPSRPPSRQDVLSTTDPNNPLPDLHIHPAPAMGPNEERMVPGSHDVFNGASRNIHVQARRKFGYLSEKNLKEHEQNALVKQKEDQPEEMAMVVSEPAEQRKRGKSPKVKPQSDAVKPKFKDLPKRNTLVGQPPPTMEERLADPPSLPRLDLGEVQRSQDRIKTKRVKQRTPIMQKSRAESYREIFVRRQSIIQQRKEELARLRRSKSTDNGIFSKDSADRVYEMFKTERNKLQTLRAANVRLGSGEYEFSSMVEKHANFFTRGTRERYRINAGHNIDDKDFEMKYKVDPETTIHDMIAQQPQVQENKKPRESPVIEYADRNMNSRFKMADRKKEREERYMKDMGYGRNKDPDITGSWQHVGEMSGQGEKLSPIPAHPARTDRSEKSTKLRKERYENMTNTNKITDYPKEDSEHVRGEETERMNGGESDLILEDYNTFRPENDDGADYPNPPSNLQDLSRDDELLDEGISEENSRLMDQFDQYVRETDYPNKDHIDAIAASFDQFVSGPPPSADQKTSENKNTNPKSNDKGKPRNVVKKPAGATTARTNRSVVDKGRSGNEGLKKTPIDLKQDRVENVRSIQAPYSTNTPAGEPVLGNMGPVIPPRPEEVTIRDKLRLEIDVLNKKDLDTHKTAKERKKIRRFWEVVDDSKQMDDQDIFGKTDNEKVVVAKVTKERRMSAKSKISKSNVSTVTQPLGKYNVTVEVA